MARPLFPLFPSSEDFNNPSNESQDIAKDWLTNSSFIKEENAGLLQTQYRDVDRQVLAVSLGAGQEHRRTKRRRKCEEKSESGRVKSKEEAKPATLWIEESGLLPEKAYRLDKKGDRSNWQYGSLYRLDVANYKRYYRELCLGLSDVDWDDDTEQTKGKKKRKKRSNIEGRYCAPEAVAIEVDVAIKRFQIRSGASKQDEPMQLNVIGLKTFQVDDYLPLPADDEQEESSTPITSLVLLSSGQPAAVSRNQSSDEQQAISIAERNTHKTKFFNETLRDNPTNVEMWLKYANFQAVEGVWQTETEGSTVSTATKDKRVAAAERKIAILEKALMKNARSAVLLKEHLSTCSLVWDHQQLAERWKDVVFKNPNSCQLWVSYLQFVQSRFSTFSVKSVQSLYNRCFTTLTNIFEGTMKSHAPEEETENTLLDIFCFQCHFLRQAGHAERAIACFQGQIEFNWFCPEEFGSTPSSGQIAFLEAFWDSGIPHFGHPNAQHWNQWFARQKDSTIPEHKTGQTVSMGEADSEADIIMPDLSTAQAWVLIEKQREATDFLPWRPNAANGETEDDCTDPDRMVLFDDISSMLFKFRDNTIKYQLLVRFIEFLSGVQLQYDVPSQQHTLSQADNLRHQSAVVHDSLLYAEAIQTMQSPVHGINDRHKQPINRQLMLFISSFLSNMLEVVSGERYTDFILKVIDLELGLLGSIGKPKKLTKQQKESLKALKKKLKAILKIPTNRNNLILWAAYSYVEVRAGNRNEASQVLCAALQQATAKGTRSAAATSEMKLAVVFRTYVETEISDFFETGNIQSKEKCLNSLVVFAEGSVFCQQNLSSVSSTRVVKAQKLCKEMATALVDQYATSKDATDLETCVETSICYAFLQYLTRGTTEYAAAFRITIEQLKISSAPISSLKRLYMAFIGLLWCHSMANHSPQHIVREVLQEALQIFPDDIQMFALYAELENRLLVVGRLRRCTDLTLKLSKTPLPWLLAILTEWNNAKKRTSPACDSQQLPVTGFVHRIRSLFDKAADLPHVQHCLLLWRLFMLFEVEQGRLDRAKAVFYRGIQQCPWAKVLYIDAVEHFPNDIEEIMSVMEEKELRVRAPVEEIELLMQDRVTNSTDES
jgi:hypothetical protein